MLLDKPAQTDAQKEEERRQIERAMEDMRQLLVQMRDASPADAERLHQRLKDACTDKRLSVDFKRKSMEDARAYECNANMRATDERLRYAMQMATGEQMKERGAALSEARKYFGKACSLGGDEEFRRAVQRLMDTIMLSGGVVRPGPTRAKPLDTAPKAPNRAKEDAPTEPVPAPPSQEQLKVLFQELVRVIPASNDRRQLEEATQAALQLMLRRTGDKELLISLQHQIKEITGSLPDVSQGDQAKADLKKAALRCIEILKQAKKLRKPRVPRPSAAVRRQEDNPNQVRNLILGVGLVAILIVGGAWLYHLHGGKSTAPQDAHTRGQNVPPADRGGIRHP